MVATSRKAAKPKDAQCNRNPGVRASTHTPRRMGTEGSGPSPLTVVYSPNAAFAQRSLAGVKATWRLASSELRQSEGRQPNAFYLTTVSDLISGLVGQEPSCPVNTPYRFKGVLILSSKASLGQRDLLCSLLNRPSDKGEDTPFLASNSLRVIRRVLKAQGHGDGDAVIAAAFAEGRVLVVQNANLAIHTFNANNHPALKNLSDEQLAAFTVDAAGSGLHWSTLGLDLDLDGLHMRPTGELEAHRSQRGFAMKCWLDIHPEARQRLNAVQVNMISSVIEGKADLSSQLVHGLAESSAISPEDLLNQLAEIQLSEQVRA